MNLLLRVIPELAWALSGGSPFRAGALACRLWTFALRNKLSGSGSTTVFALRYRGAAFSLALRYNTDIASMHEVFCLHEYEWPSVGHPKTIIDLGAHFGDTALYYHVCFPDAAVIAVEPSPESFARLVENTRGIASVVAVQCAISDHDGTAQLHLTKSSFGHSLSSREAGAATVAVPACTLKTLLARRSLERADLVKFDIEGSEAFLFTGARPSDLGNAFIGEVHEDIMGTSVDDFLKVFGPEFETHVQQLPQRGRYLLKAQLKHPR